MRAWPSGPFLICLILLLGTTLTGLFEFKYLKYLNVFIIDAEVETLEPDLEFGNLAEVTTDKLLPGVVPEDLLKEQSKDVCERSPEAGVLFTSDNFPGHYNKDTDCNYTMKAAPGKRVELTFFLFDVSTLVSVYGKFSIFC